MKVLAILIIAGFSYSCRSMNDKQSVFQSSTTADPQHFQSYARHAESTLPGADSLVERLMPERICKRQTQGLLQVVRLEMKAPLAVMKAASTPDSNSAKFNFDRMVAAHKIKLDSAKVKAPIAEFEQALAALNGERINNDGLRVKEVNATCESRKESAKRLLQLQLNHPEVLANADQDKNLKTIHLLLDNLKTLPPRTETLSQSKAN